MSQSIRVGRCALVLGLFTLHCGGAQFTSEPDGQGASGNSGGTKNSAPITSAGDGSGDNQVDPSRGGSSANSGGDDGGDDTPEPMGSGGDSGVVSNGGEGGSGTTGGTDPGVDDPIELDLTACGADAFGTGIMPTLYSTLDSAEAITDPAIGVLGFVGNAEGDYHGDHCGTAINIDQSSDYVKYHYQDEGTRHFNPMVGAMDFWYRPSYAHTDGMNHHLFGTANWQTAGGFRLRKAAGDLQNAFQVMIASSTFQVLEINVPANAYAFSPGVWTRISLVWYLSPDFEERYVRLFLNGTEAGEVAAPVTFQMAPDANGFMVLGVWDFNDPGHASGWIDDFKIFGRGP
jgi:hypothetical protein